MIMFGIVWHINQIDDRFLMLIIFSCIQLVKNTNFLIVDDSSDPATNFLSSLLALIQNWEQNLNIGKVMISKTNIADFTTVVDNINGTIQTAWMALRMSVYLIQSLHRLLVATFFLTLISKWWLINDYTTNLSFL